MPIPLEDNFEDIISKAQRGLGLTDEVLARHSGLSAGVISELKSGKWLEDAARRIAPPLGLDADRLVASGSRTWFPEPVELNGLLAFNSPYGSMSVNHYLVFDPVTRAAALFDTGAETGPAMAALRDGGLRLERIYLTHTHPDHIAVLDAWRAAFPGVVVKVGRGEMIAGAEAVDNGMTFTLGDLAIEARETSGHSPCGITYVVQGLDVPLAIVGDALFAGSMGGAVRAWETALEANRRQILSLPGFTVICPGHGPVTTVAEERAHNPFYPERKPSL